MARFLCSFYFVFVYFFPPGALLHRPSLPKVKRALRPLEVRPKVDNGAYSYSVLHWVIEPLIDETEPSRGAQNRRNAWWWTLYDYIDRSLSLPLAHTLYPRAAGSTTASQERAHRVVGCILFQLFPSHPETNCLCSLSFFCWSVFWVPFFNLPFCRCPSAGLMGSCVSFPLFGCLLNWCFRRCCLFVLFREAKKKKIHRSIANRK